jgi:hypothetical protein
MLPRDAAADACVAAADGADPPPSLRSVSPPVPPSAACTSSTLGSKSCQRRWAPSAVHGVSKTTQPSHTVRPQEGGGVVFRDDQRPHPHHQPKTPLTSPCGGSAGSQGRRSHHHMAGQLVAKDAAHTTTWRVSWWPMTPLTPPHGGAAGGQGRRSHQTIHSKGWRESALVRDVFEG